MTYIPHTYTQNQSYILWLFTAVININFIISPSSCFLFTVESCLCGHHSFTSLFI